MKLQLIPVLLKDELFDLLYQYAGKRKSNLNSVRPDYYSTIEILFIVNNRITSINLYILEVILNKYKDKIKIKKRYPDVWITTIRNNNQLADELYSFIHFFFSNNDLNLRKIT